MPQRKLEDKNEDLERKRRTQTTGLCILGYAIFGLGIILAPQGFAVLGAVCIFGGLVVGSIGLVAGWFHRSTIKLAPLKVTMCVCLALGLGGCIVDMTLPDTINSPVTGEWLIYLLGESTNPFVLVSVAGWTLFLLGTFVTGFRIK